MPMIRSNFGEVESYVNGIYGRTLGLGYRTSFDVVRKRVLEQSAFPPRTPLCNFKACGQEQQPISSTIVMD